MMTKTDEHAKVDTAGKGQPRFGSYLGLFYVAAILGILSFALLHDSGIGHAFAGLRPGMTPTEVAAVLGVPRSETRTGPRLVQTWRMPDDFIIEVRFRDGKLIAKERRAEVSPAP
jgi:hypothetical protein